jgi:hypothetical protein
MLRINELTNALMIKQRRHAVGSNKHGKSTAYHQRLSMINLKAIAVN